MQLVWITISMMEKPVCLALRSILVVYHVQLINAYLAHLQITGSYQRTETANASKASWESIRIVLPA